MKKEKGWRIRHHKPFYQLWYFYLIFVVLLVYPNFFNLFFRGLGFNNPLIAVLFWLFVVFFSSFFVSMAIHLIHDASTGKKRFKK
jgi:polyferredoxin